MQTISVDLPESLGEAILCEQRRERMLGELEAELIKGIESGFGEPISADYWANMREKLQQHLAREREGRQ